MTATLRFVLGFKSFFSNFKLKKVFFMVKKEKFKLKKKLFIYKKFKWLLIKKIKYKLKFHVSFNIRQ